MSAARERRKAMTELMDRTLNVTGWSDLTDACLYGPGRTASIDFDPITSGAKASLVGIPPERDPLDEILEAAGIPDDSIERRVLVARRSYKVVQ